MLEPIKRRRLVDEAATRIRRAIFDGVFTPGEHLQEDRLAAMLGISRTPLREGFRMLEEEGLVVLSHGRGVEVVQPDPEDSSDVYDIREVLDGLAARRAAERISAEQLAGLEALVSDMEEALEVADFSRWMESNVRFHDLVAVASHNRRLPRFLPAIRVTVQMFHPVLVSDPNRPLEALREHKAILTAIRRRDAEAADQAARLHIRNAKALLVDRLGR